MKDLHSNIKPVQAIAPVLVKDATTPAAVEIDLAGFNSAEIVFSIGLKSVDTGTFTLKLEHADDNGSGAAGSYTNAAAADVLGVTPSSGVIFTIDADADADTSCIKRCGYVGGKRFIKLTIAEAGSNANGVIMGVNVVKGHPLDSPTAA